MTTKTKTLLTGELTLNEISLAVPRALEVFNRYGLDSCCGGAKPLALVCEKHGLDLEAVLGELRLLA
jgi:regulator of cell morphogenesis and NO signaling